MMTSDLVEQKAKLESERQTLLDELAQLEESLKNGTAEDEATIGLLSNYGNHLADDASFTFEQEKNLALDRSLRVQLQHVERAIAKLEDGTYGRCDTCDQPIEENRLRALAHATQCMACKKKEETRLSA